MGEKSNADKYREQYNATYSHYIRCKLNKKFDTDLIEFYSNQPNKNATMKQALIEYMQNHKDDNPILPITTKEQPITPNCIKSAVTTYNKLMRSSGACTTFNTICFNSTTGKVFATDKSNQDEITDDVTDLLNFAMRQGYPADKLKVSMANVKLWAEDVLKAKGLM